jgi:mRNA-degrading endonuclease RelE of RelBE toxin-antitoxin system
LAKERFRIRLWPQAEAELNALRAYDRRTIAEQMRQQLTNEPATPSRHRKLLGTVEASFDYRPPLWELRVGEFRVFYDVDAAEMMVNIRAVRHKPAGMSTAEVLR